MADKVVVPVRVLVGGAFITGKARRIAIARIPNDPHRNFIRHSKICKIAVGGTFHLHAGNSRQSGRFRILDSLVGVGVRSLSHPRHRSVRGALRIEFVQSKERLDRRGQNVNGCDGRARFFIICVTSRISPNFDVPSRLRTEIVSVNRGNPHVLAGIGYRQSGARRGPEIHIVGKEADGIRRVEGDGLRSLA